MASQPINVVLCWHMHQPYYREGQDGDFQLPWVYLHGIKDYTDMVTHLENHPQMSTVVNFSPVLLEQLDDYVQELDAYLNTSAESSRHLSDPLLGMLAGERPIPETSAGRKRLFEDCQRCYAPRMIEPYPAFNRLMKCLEDAFAHAGEHEHFPLRYLEDQFFYDLIVWYHLAWLGHSLRDSETIQGLMQKEHDYTTDDRNELLKVIHEALAGIIPRYRKLAEREQIELSFTPYAHPIIPLLNSFDNMACAQPEAPRPECEDYPQGKPRSIWHLEKGIASFKHYFGRKPDGVWLSEGGVSGDALELLDDFGIKWTATGEQVWRNTCNLVGCDQEAVDTKRALFMPYQYQDQKSRVFFRDDGLSDLIGFEYSHWNAADAARNFAENLQNIAVFLGDQAREQVVSIILDGENAWEYYINNGYDFLDALYRELVKCPDVNMLTFSEASQLEAQRVDQLCAGSWVYGSFSTWIGQEDKNRAWEYLVAAKQACDEVVKQSQLSTKKLQQLEDQLAICEGSDWFWWFGDYNPSNSVNDFDELFRMQVKKLYGLIGQAAPEYLDQPISLGGGDNTENAGTMRRN